MDNEELQVLKNKQLMQKFYNDHTHYKNLHKHLKILYIPFSKFLVLNLSLLIESMDDIRRKEHTS